jgi:hypothetical protein
MPDELPTASVTVTLSLNAETEFTEILDMVVRITNDTDVIKTFWSKTPAVNIQLPFHNSPQDDYRVIVHVKGYETAGAFVHADPTIHHMVNMLMIPSHATFGFPSWADLVAEHPETARLIAAGVSENAAIARYLALGKAKPLSLASLMNLCAAMESIGLGDQKTPMDFIKEVIWDDTLAQDRFFGYADPAIIPLVRAAATEDEFAEEKDCATFHPGSTCSFKQTEFDYSNVQLTFHQGDKKTIGGVECVKIEPDMDLYKEIVAHGLGEVLPNLSTGGLTNPLDVLALRWIDAVQSDEPLFDPGYLLS